MTEPHAASATGIHTDPSRTVAFTFEDRPITAVAGQSLAAALYAAGVRVFSRSFKYHRPRGLFCCSGDCPNCLMQVDGRPNVRTCIEPARDGQVVHRQNAWPSADFDVLRVFDKLDRFLPVGFYYKRFHKPRWLWPIFEHTVRHIAGLGRIDVNALPETETEIEHIDTQVCVVGGGPAGLAAAEEAGRNGASVLLLERMPRLGGTSLFNVFGGQGPGDIFGIPEWTVTIETIVRECPRIRILCDTTAFGLYEGNLLGAFCGNRLLKIRAKHVVVCTGAREQPFLFHNNDLPGIFLGRGALRLARHYGVMPGRQAVVLTATDHGYWLAELLLALGINVAAIVDRRPAADRPVSGLPARSRVEHCRTLLTSVAVAAQGNSRIKSIRVAQADAHGAALPETEEEIACDLLCMASALQPANELLLQAGVRFEFVNGRWQISRAVPGVWAAGAAVGTPDEFGPGHANDGRLRGAEIAAALGYPVPQLDKYRQRWQQGLAEMRGYDVGSPTQLSQFSNTGTSPRGQHKRFVCLCEDVTDKDLEQAIAEGFDGIETLKRYSTANMGPCQGKMCGVAAAEICARATGRDINAVGTTTSRPPAVPVELGVLAAASHHPVRRTSLHHWHEAAGAKWMDAGQWKRPESYGDPVAEVIAVRNSVGLIDVSTLGKIEVVGPDAVELLERVYLNKWSDLKIGRSRYGVMCNEDGIIFDDGVCARLAADRFYLTATTGNAEGVFQWLELWCATWGLEATILNHTSGFAAMNLAGPRSRELLGQLTPLDISNASFPYMAMREAEVAGVPCRLLRIGFVGELGYEIHCPSALAWHLWESLIEAGREFGLKSFGVESQRILRLEKGHIIIGADTDALSNPLEAGLEWLVRFDKPDFIGRGPLVRMRDRGPRSRLVGFMIPECNQAVPEGCQVVDRGYPIGRITSSRVSPTVSKSLGLAWVPANKSATGTRFLIRWSGSDVEAIVTRLPFYDPDGKRLRA